MYAVDRVELSDCRRNMRIHRMLRQTENDGDLSRGLAFARPFDDLGFALRQTSRHFLCQDFLVQLVEDTHDVKQDVGDLALVRLLANAAEHQTVSPPLWRKERNQQKRVAVEFVEHQIGGIAFQLCALAENRGREELRGIGYTGPIGVISTDISDGYFQQFPDYGVDFRIGKDEMDARTLQYIIREYVTYDVPDFWKDDYTI
jgi:hypothetical protein